MYDPINVKIACCRARCAALIMLMKAKGAAQAPRLYLSLT